MVVMIPPRRSGKNHRFSGRVDLRKLGRDGGVVVGRGVAVGVEGGLNDLGRNCAFAANAPVVATKFDDS